jgi:hypothetical protein
LARIASCLIFWFQPASPPKNNKPGRSPSSNKEFL